MSEDTKYLLFRALRKHFCIDFPYGEGCKHCSNESLCEDVAESIYPDIWGSDNNLFVIFKKLMRKEYLRHYPTHQDEWKEWEIDNFISFVSNTLQSVSDSELRINPNHLIDIANYCLLLHARLVNGDK